MIEYIDECVDCPKEMGCLGCVCPKRNVPHFICDDCGDDVDDLYYFDGEQLCVDCIIKKLEKVEVMEE